jgi:hypothetical protein
MEFDKDIRQFISACHAHNVRMMMVGGGAVNFHGYQRHSSDVDFWISTSSKNLTCLSQALLELGFESFEFPEQVIKNNQNISIKFSPQTILEVELITRFSLDKSFDEAYKDAQNFSLANYPEVRWKVLSVSDLINSKIKAGRSKDLIDVQELKRIHRI